MCKKKKSTNLIQCFQMNKTHKILLKLFEMMIELQNRTTMTHSQTLIQ